MTGNRMSPDLIQPSQSTSLSKDEVFDILSNARRRYVLYHLRETQSPVELGDLANEVAAWENETSVDDLTKQQRKRVYVSLYQTHIQKLQDAGIVEYDTDSGMVSLANGAGQIGSFLSADEQDTNRARWQVAYVLMAAVSGVLYTLVTFDVSAFGLIPEYIMGIVIVLGFAGLATVHYFSNQRTETDIPTEALVRTRR